MAKDKKGSKAAASAPKTEVAKPLENIKAGRVTKPIEQAKASAKQTAKKAAEGVEKTSKKVKKAIEPESSDDDSDVTSDSSASSDEEEVETKAAPKLNGKANGKAAKANDSSSEDESDSDEESDDEVADKTVSAPKTNGAAKDDDSDDDSSEASDSDEDEAPKVNGKAAAATADSDEEDDDDDDSSEASDSDDEVDAKAGAKKAADVDDDDSDADSSEGSSDDDDEEEVAKPVAKETGKKRKAEDAIEQTPKKTKATVEGELKDATPNLFVGNLSWNVDEDWLTREFESFGELASVRIITDRDSGRSKGFGYVEFNNAEKAAEALEAMQGAQIDGREIRVDFSVPRQNRAEGQTPQQRSFDRAQKYGDTPKEPSATLFVGNVSFDSDESTLTDLFQEHGTVKGVRLPTDRESGQMKGFGYVEFYDIEEAKAAFEALQGAELGGRALRLDYSTPRSNDSPGGRGGRGGGDRGGFRGGFRGGDRGGRGGGRGGFGDRGRGRGGARGGRGNTTNRGGFGDFSGKKMTF